MTPAELVLRQEESARQAVRQVKQVTNDARELAALKKRVARLEEFLGGDGLAEVLGMCNARQSDRLIDEVRGLIANALKAHGAMRYRGVWAETVAYDVSDTVTHAGTLWVARADSAGLKPGSGNAAWQLVLKSHA